MRKCYSDAAWKLSKYGVIFGPNTGKYGPEITPYLDTLHTVIDIVFLENVSYGKK